MYLDEDLEVLFVCEVVGDENDPLEVPDPARPAVHVQLPPWQEYGEMTVVTALLVQPGHLTEKIARAVFFSPPPSFCLK